MPTTITPQELWALRNQGKNIELIDVRTPVEFREVHVEFARNIPLDRLDPQRFLQERGSNKDEPLYLICKSGSRGQRACDLFEKVGFVNVINVEGGTQNCEKAGLPVVRGKKAISLERQVRIAAGSLVFLGGLLSLLVSEWFAILPAMVGCGLVFAGITNTCGMGMLLARMPWNQCNPQPTCGTAPSESTNNGNSSDSNSNSSNHSNNGANI
ncbi:MAG: rhodanese-like domain-containing protein [Gemmataceae bacterium]|nr:rhodanese-like domain-containing protein [Gemmataceae bacterium]